mmetsp:Transcript_10242/g.27927  ORF Transcript_10242/g.27927 Transcript_10242/m.27927 type:complete len:342 (-) Transcript_10242:21-1046(-)|eukprot:CAMPEP_0182611074 /NCGR_PEP_ID=MMETSP1330-20130603/12177_1 /TAXON_ID=464278 /ORGANISM="Picochlorum sp., Strain RCC944" /LENGTH=341 /DNA_ID=CAMNT_0024830421 /DNA_START=98 /DNA_END=1123 /DNA_ORIENTATION=+
MAKWGEGDDRWKVAELGNSGRNVNGWHWEERDCLPWAKKRLSELIPAKLVLVDSGGVRATGDGKVKVSGEAVINRRKGKVIPAYELDVSFGWTATGPDGETYTGNCKVPYVSEENHDEDPEVQFTVKETGREAEKVRAALVKEGRGVVHGIVHLFVRELRSGGPDVGSSGCDASDRSAQTQPEAAAAAPKPAAKPPQGNSITSKKSLEIVEQYYASSKDIFDCFVDGSKVKAYTGSAATIEPVAGGKVSMFGGSIEGKFTRLEPDQLIEMDWRFSSWGDDCVSKVRIELEEKDRGSVTLKLTQSGIPEEDRFGNHDTIKVTEMGWRSQILTRMKQVFGYGM